LSGNPYSDGLASAALTLLVRGLRGVKKNPTDQDARTDCQLGIFQARGIWINVRFHNLHVFTIYLYLFTAMHSTFAQHICTAHLHSTFAQHICTAHLHSTFAQHICTAHPAPIIPIPQAVQACQSGPQMGASHAIGHILGPAFDVPHGYTSCVALPAVLRWNAEA